MFFYVINKLRAKSFIFIKNKFSDGLNVLIVN